MNREKKSILKRCVNTLVSYSKKSLPKIKAEIKAMKEKPPVEPTKGFFTNKKTHQSNQVVYAIELRTHRTNNSRIKSVNWSASKEWAYQNIAVMSIIKQSKEQRPDLAQASYEATAWDKETQRLQQELEQLSKPQEQEQVQKTKGKDIDWVNELTP